MYNASAGLYIGTIPLHRHTTRWGLWSSAAAKNPRRGKMETLSPKKIEP